MLTYAEKMLALEDEARTDVTGAYDHTGVLRIGATDTLMTYCLPAVLRRFHAMFPQIQLAFQSQVDQVLYTSVTTGALDFALLLQPLLHVETVAVEPLQAERLLVIAPAGHPLALRQQVGPKDLIGETIMLTGRGCGYRFLFEQELAKEGNYGCVKLEINSIEAIKQAVCAGLGVGFLPEVVVEAAIARGDLVALNWEQQFVVRTQLIWHRLKWLSPTEVIFVELCKAMLSTAQTQTTAASPSSHGDVATYQSKP